MISAKSVLTSLCLLLSGSMVLAGEARWYLTAKQSKDRLTPKGDLVFTSCSKLDEEYPTIFVDSSKRYQTIEGFGGALTDAAAETFYKLPTDRQQELLTAYFDPEKGLGYSLCRTNIHSCDFSNGSYVYDNDANDKGLKRFSIEHDQSYRIPFIKAAISSAKGSLKIFASPWSPPAWMKTNGNMLQGGKLKPDCADAWALYFTKFVRAYEKEGIPIWGLTVQNEPMASQTWESCLFTGEEERDFVRDHLGPTLKKSGLSRLRLMIWDHNRGLLYPRAKAVFDDPKASRYVWGTAFHWYSGDHFDNVRQIHDAWPDKKVFFSEGCAESFDAQRINEWQWGEKYGLSMLQDLNNWSVGWVDWNVLLDERGGPNHVGNFCYAPVHGDTAKGTLHYMNSFYYLGHFSKFVRPGAQRIAATSNDDRLLTTAFRNPNGKLSVIVLNLKDEDISFLTWINGQAAKTTSPAHSILTMVY